MNKVFISFKNTYNGKLTEDYSIAKQLENVLRQNGIDVFFSEVSLAESAKSNYKDVIDSELDRSNILVLIGTKADYIISPWVKYEWDNFLQNIISGIKPDNEIFCLFSSIKPEDKPVGIRFKQTFLADANGINSLVAFICSKADKQPKQLCTCVNCGEIFDIHKNFSCRYHPMDAVLSKIKYFDGTEQKFWVFPCCNKKTVCTDENEKPKRSNGCVIGKHKI